MGRDAMIVGGSRAASAGGERAAPGRGHRALTATLASVGLALFGLSLLSDPATSGIFPDCPFRLVTGGLHCPGCGTLRALHQLGHGNLRAAFALNPLAVLALPVLLLCFLRALVPRRPGCARRPWSPYLGWAVLGVVLVWWVLRNLVGTAA